ncbi:GNAT family N-acetyltransferase [Sanguibacter suaedae]|uniref:GNAT family N-acetyltransferase n=1 Tax=Sanguibacter suaedae TaxID=2795737 RepID=A0A934IC36_9MICO|nr:GNAT family N-acetyltransferase [Sanguibacter suaedae]MBI9115050.1 GNAT family N-acetyltransferase [Sanguibacter suaedae]
MTLPTPYRLVQLDDGRREDVLRLDRWAFPDAPSVEDAEGVPLPLDWERTVGVVRDAPDEAAVPIDGAVPTRTDLAAMHSSYRFSRFPVPGARTPVAGLTWVAVHPQDRRRGLLTAMIDHHLAQCLERGETVSALFAAEAAIYGRFGYGHAADDLRVRIPRGAALHPVTGSDRLTVRVEELDPARHGGLVADLHERAGTQAGILRPGWATRETEALRAHHLSDVPALRGGRETRKIVVVEADGEPRGYTVLRRALRWETPGPRGTVHAGEVVALDPAAAHRLWSTLLDLDLMSEVEPFVLPVDDPIMGLLVDPRSAQPRVADNLWVRLVDVAGALAARRYACHLDLVLHVADDRLEHNDGTWRLQSEGLGPVHVERTTDAPDLAVTVGALGSAYLGGVSLTALAGAGAVEEHTDGALLRASAAFGWPLAPVCSWVF